MDIQMNRWMDRWTAPSYNMSTFKNAHIHTVMKFHQYFPVGYQVMPCTTVAYTKYAYNSQRDKTLKQNNKKQPLIQIPIILHEDIPNSFMVMAIQECLEKQSKGHNLESMKGGTIILVPNRSC